MRPLERRPLGQTALSVSALGLGTVKLGRNTGMKYPEAYPLPSDQQAAELLAVARAGGINLLDTAPAYGSSEERLGQLLRGQRHHWVLCSKVGEEFDGHCSHFDFSAAHTRMSIERSLRRLGSDYLDIVLVHSSGEDVDIIENSGVFDTLLQCRQQGLIRAFGMSTKTVAGGILAARESDCVMLSYSLAHTDEAAVIDECRRLGKGVLLKKVLASGHICHTPDHADPVTASMKFIFAKPGISSAIIGTINPAHLASNIASAADALHRKPHND